MSRRSSAVTSSWDRPSLPNEVSVGTGFSAAAFSNQAVSSRSAACSAERAATLPEGLLPPLRRGPAERLGRGPDERVVVDVRPDGRRPEAYEDKEVLRCGVEAAPRGLHRQRLLSGARLEKRPRGQLARGSGDQVSPKYSAQPTSGGVAAPPIRGV